MFGIEPKYSKSSLGIVDMFLELQQNLVWRNQFYHKLIDINKSSYDISCNKMTILREMTLLEDLLYST